MGSKPNVSLVPPIVPRPTIQRGVAIRTVSRQESNSAISVVHPAELSSETQQTLGSLRLAAIAAMNGIVSSLWAGIFVVEPSAKTGIHHHGKQDTVVYVLEGEARVRWGNLGEHSATVGAGDFLHVPGWLPHQEINPSKEHPFRWVVVRSTPEPIVVNLPDNFWPAADPNPHRGRNANEYERNESTSSSNAPEMIGPCLSAGSEPLSSICKSLTRKGGVL
jgi:uncharacterized RmlC-like cupin family protein